MTKPPKSRGPSESVAEKPATGAAKTKRGPGRPRTVPIEAQRETILVAARRVFAEHDFHGTTIERVAREAGVARPLVYELFGGKDELFIAVVDDAIEHLISFMINRFQERPPSLKSVVRDNVANLFEFIDAYPDTAAIIRIAELGGFGPAKHEVVLGRHRIEDGLASVFSATWRPEGSISYEASRVLALTTLALVEAVGFRQPSEPQWRTDDTIDLIAEFILGGLRQLARDPDRISTFGEPDAPSKRSGGRQRRG